MRAGTRYGEHFRTLGNWVFIPAVYLACEVREGVSASEAIRHAGVIIASSPIALALVCAIQVYDQRQRGNAATSFGPPATDWFLPAAATAMAVFAATALVEIFNLAQGQWVSAPRHTHTHPPPPPPGQKKKNRQTAIAVAAAGRNQSVAGGPNEVAALPRSHWS